MAVVALLSMRMTRTVDDQLVIIDHNYFPAYVALAQANIHSVEESGYVRRLLLATAERPDSPAKVDDLRRRIATAGKASDEQIADARQHINEQIADPLDFDDNIALARLDVRIEGLQEERQRYEPVLGKLLPAAEADNEVLATELLAELDDWRDDFDRKIDAARGEMRRLAGAAIVGTPRLPAARCPNWLGAVGDRHTAWHHRRRRRHPRPGASDASSAGWDRRG
jgi:adenylate cyclase